MNTFESFARNVFCEVSCVYSPQVHVSLVTVEVREGEGSVAQR